MAETISKERLNTLKNEVLMAQKLNTEELEPIIAESLARYTSEYIPSYGKDWDIVLNEVYPIIQNNLPSTFFRNPRAFLKPRNKTYIAKKRNPVSGKMEDTQIDSTKSARTQEHILNYQVVEIKYKKEARKCLLDSLLFPHAVMWHGYKGDFGMTEEQSIDIKDERIFVRRVSPLRFIKDPSVTMSNIDEGKWVGRILDIPLLDLIEDDKLDVEPTIKGFKGFGNKVHNEKSRAIQQQGLDRMSVNSLKGSLIDYADKEWQNSRAAEFVRVYEIYLRPTKKEKRDGKKGWIILLTDAQHKPLRINEWKIKAEGFPAKILQFNELPDAMFGLNDMDTYKSVADQKNVVVNLQLRNAQEHTKTWVGISKAGMEEHDIQRVQEGQNSIIFFDGDIKPSERMFVSSPGGAPSGELYVLDKRIQENLEDKSGVTDLRRGQLRSGEESAASVKLRSAGGGARPAYRQDIVADWLKESFLYLNQLTKQFLPYKDAVRIVGSLDLEWSEAPTKEEIQADIDVELDVISMLPENPEKEIREINTLLALMFQALTVPEIRQKIEQEGKTVNISPLIEQLLLRMRVRNPDVFRNIEPQESQGFVSVQQMREARANVDAALEGRQIQHPPKMDDDHVAKLEVYSSIRQLLEKAGQTSEMLEQLIQMHAALLQEIQKKQPKAGQQVKLQQPKISTMGTL